MGQKGQCPPPCASQHLLLRITFGGWKCCYFRYWSCILSYFNGTLKNLFLLINAKKVLIFMYIFEAMHMYTHYLKSDNRWYLKAVSFHSKSKIKWIPINMGIQRRYQTNPPCLGQLAWNLSMHLSHSLAIDIDRYPHLIPVCLLGFTVFEKMQYQNKTDNQIIMNEGIKC